MLYNAIKQLARFRQLGQVEKKIMTTYQKCLEKSDYLLIPKKSNPLHLAMVTG